jgi:hypothetical protein
MCTTKKPKKNQSITEIYPVTLFTLQNNHSPQVTQVYRRNHFSNKNKNEARQNFTSASHEIYSQTDTTPGRTKQQGQA